MLIHRAFLLLALWTLPALADWTSTRVTTYDWICTDAAGTVISGHQRQDAAFASCSNLTLKDGVTRYVQGGKYKVTATVIPPTAGSATVSWAPPTQNTDGSDLTDLAGYRIEYGTSAASLTQTVTVPGNASAYTINGLSAGTWYFTVRTTATSGTESEPSMVASKTLE